MIVLFSALRSVSWVISQVFSRNLYKYLASWKTVHHLTLFIIYCILQGDESAMPQEQNDDAIQNKARKRPHVWDLSRWTEICGCTYVTVTICLGKDLSSISRQPTSEMQGCSSTLHLVKTGFVFCCFFSGTSSSNVPWAALMSYHHLQGSSRAPKHDTVIWVMSLIKCSSFRTSMSDVVKTPEGVF